MAGRGSESPEQMALRLRTAKSEMASAAEFDYVVVNDDLDRCVAEIEEIIAKERSRPDRPPVRL
jgi:guanylate kinase